MLIVRPHTHMRLELQRLVVAAGIEARVAATGVEALAAARRERPAVVLLDVELPDGSGYEICHRLREEHGEWLPIILLSGQRTDPLDRIASFLIGADDYISDPFDPDELIARVRRAVTRSSAVVATTVARAVGWSLTERERDVLGLLAEGLTQVTIADRLVISSKTVATHIQRILAKLDVHSRAEAIAVAYRQGFIVAEASPVALAVVR
ncbi:MAG: response regulator transcription factor [Actinomycetota bacterium]|nr:response regulator transcription factor [Actinomycetota bacterium]